MDSHSLKPVQARKIYTNLFPGLNYLLRLKTRMEQRGFPADDVLYRKVVAAYEASKELSRQMHDLGHPPGVGRKSRRGDGAKQAESP